MIGFDSKSRDVDTEAQRKHGRQFVRAGVVLIVVLSSVGVASVVGSAGATTRRGELSSVAGAASVSDVLRSNAREAHRRPHAQALKGSLKSAHVKRVVFILKGGRGGGGDPGDDYPAVWRDKPQDSMLDNWLEYNRECTSFVAWALSSRNGYNMRFHANANQWGPKAQALGYAVNSTPAPGSVAWSNAGAFGHVAYVEGVSGGSVYIEEYNEHGNGTYDSRTVPASTFTGYIHFDDRPAAPVVSPEPAPAHPTPEPTHPTETEHAGTTPTSTGTTSTPAPTPTPTPSPVTYTEQEANSNGVNTFSDYQNASGLGPKIGAGQYVQVSCKIYDPSIASVSPDGYWYRIASSPWNNAYYSPANTFWNGSMIVSGPGVKNTDFSVPDC